MSAYATVYLSVTVFRPGAFNLKGVAPVSYTHLFVPYCRLFRPYTFIVRTLAALHAGTDSKKQFRSPQ